MSAGPQTSDSWTVQRILDWTTSHLKKHGSDSPRLDAEILLAHARNCRRIELYTRFDEVLTEAQRATMRDLVQRRARHEPVAYLVGRRDFYNLTFKVTRDVLVPRPETETLVMEALETLKPLESPAVLDIGTGSGCIAVTIAKNHPTARVTAVDISESALAIARENAELNGVASRIQFLQGDLFSPVDPALRFDLIASNPPYVREDEFESLQPDVRLHEPKLALVSGGEGLDVVRRLAAESHGRLAPAGRILIEIAPEQSMAVENALRDAGKYSEVRTIRDASHDPRIVSALRISGEA